MDSSIHDFGRSIKWHARNNARDIITLLIIVAVALGAFALGRLSVIPHEPVKIISPGTTQPS